MCNQAEYASVDVDWTDIGSATTRAEVESTFYTLGRKPEPKERAWDLFVSEQTTNTPRGLIVMTDLSRCAASFRRTKPQRWSLAVRSANPYIVAFVRNKQDERCAAMVDDIVHASQNRLVVCSKTAGKSLQTCISRALAGIDPNSIIDARFADDTNSLWLEFGDGRKTILDWSRLGLDEVKPALIPSSVTVSDDLDAIQVPRRDGSLFDIDSTAVRSLIDGELSNRLDKTAGDITDNLGLRLKRKRKGLGLTQTELAGQSGLEQALISKMEQGRHQPRFTTLSKVAKGLNLSVTELLA